MSDDEDTGRPVLRVAVPDDAAALMKLKQRLAEASGQGIGTRLLKEAT